MTKPNSRMDRNELVEAVDEKKALPDLVLKRVIFSAQEELYNAESRLMYNQLRNNGVPNQNDIYKFRVSILKMFRLVSRMAKENGCTSLPDGNDSIYKKSDWELLEYDLAYNRVFQVRMLIRFSSYLTYVLHQLNLTNLLISDGSKANSEDTF